jgi:hypothetical protein
MVPTILLGFHETVAYRMIIYLNGGIYYSFSSLFSMNNDYTVFLLILYMKKIDTKLHKNFTKKKKKNILLLSLLQYRIFYCVSCKPDKIYNCGVILCDRGKIMYN